MEIVTFSHYKEIDQDLLKDSYAIVIDVLRATTVMITALSNGAKKIIPVEEVDEAKLLKKLNSDILLGGERNIIKIEEFEFDNSPLSYKKDIVENKIIAITTTNGTRALKKSIYAKKIFIGSFINAKVTAYYVIKEAVKNKINRIAIVCAGRKGRLALEDILCAGYFVDIIKDILITWQQNQYKEFNENLKLDDLSICAFEFYKKFENNPLEIFKCTSLYNILIELGLKEDIKFCFKKDSINCICEYKDLFVEKVNDF